MKLLHIVEWNGTMLHSGMKWSCFIWKGVFYEAFWGAAAKYEAQLTLHEAALRAMERSLTASCFFALESRQKNGRDCFNCSENISQPQKGCKLVKNAHRFVKLRKYLCFQHFWKQRQFFYSTERTFSPKQLQNTQVKDDNLRLL